MSTVHSSPGVYTREIDLSQAIAGVASSIGATVGWSKKGPVGTPTLVTNTKKFIETFGKPDASISFMHYCSLAFLEEANRLYVVRVAPGAKYGGAVVSTENQMNTAAAFDSGQADPSIYNFQPNDLFVIHAIDPGRWNNELKVHVYPNTKVFDNSFYIDVYLLGTNQPVERFLVHMDLKVDGYGVQINVEEHINSRSNYIRIVQNKDNPEYVANPAKQFINTLNVVTFAGGDDGTQPTVSDIVNAWDLFKDKEKIKVNLLINSGYTDVAVQQKMNALCESRMDCLAILDTPSNLQKVQDALNYRRNQLAIDSSYSALYTPDYLVLDQYNDIRIYVPPSGHVAAAYARTDRDYELWFAPAGMNRGKLNVLGVRHVYNQGDRDTLYESQINATRVISGAGIKIWGADTLQTMTSALSNVSVRRLMIFLEESISLAALYSVFDPNDSILRTQLREIAERFLRPIQQARGLMRFEVICDDSNNPPEIIANGDLMLDVYLDPVLPAKRIHLTAIVQKTGARFVAANV